MISAPGKNFLFVVGILYIVFGVFGIIISVAGLATADFWDRTLPTAIGMSWSVYYTMALPGCLFHIIVGIMGVKNRTRLEKASMLRVLGSIDIGLVILGTIFVFFVFSGAFAVLTAFFTLALGCVLPILYLVGAQKNHDVYIGQ